MEFSPKIAPCLWFASEAEEAARYYTGIFPNSKIGKIARYGKEGFETHRQKPGTVLTVQFDLARQTFTALNGGPQFKFSEAILKWHRGSSSDFRLVLRRKKPHISCD